MPSQTCASVDVDPPAFEKPTAVPRRRDVHRHALQDVAVRMRGGPGRPHLTVPDLGETRRRPEPGAKEYPTAIYIVADGRDATELSERRSRRSGVGLVDGHAVTVPDLAAEARRHVRHGRRGVPDGGMHRDWPARRNGSAGSRWRLPGGFVVGRIVIGGHPDASSQRHLRSSHRRER